MAVAAFILGGILGMIGAIATLILTEAGWGAAVMVYFALGYAVPVVALVAMLIRTAPDSQGEVEASGGVRKARVVRH